MLFLVVLIALVQGQISFSTQCTCTELQSQQDCINLGCTWSDNKCSSTRCSSFKSEVLCILAVSRCAWSKSTSQCISNDCATLKTKLVETCSYYGCGQSTLPNSDNSFSCTNSVQCSQINQQLTCQSYPYCGWQNNTCYDQTCSEQSFTAGCPPVRTGVLNNRSSVLCFGSSFKCRNATATDIDGLFSFNCSPMTGYSFTWSTALNKCVPCSSSTLISINISINSTQSINSSQSTNSTQSTNSSTTVNNTIPANTTNPQTSPATNNTNQTQTSPQNNTQTSVNSTSNSTNTTTDSYNLNCTDCNNSYNNITYINTYAYMMVFIEIAMILL